MKDLNFYLRETLAVSLLLVVALIIATKCTGCGPSQQAKEAAAEGAYAAEHLKCVDAYDTNEDINRCRSEVRRRWGIAETVRDGGSDAAH